MDKEVEHTGLDGFEMAICQSCLQEMSTKGAKNNPDCPQSCSEALEAVEKTIIHQLTSL